MDLCSVYAAFMQPEKNNQNLKPKDEGTCLNLRFYPILTNIKILL